MPQTHSRSRTAMDESYQGGLRSRSVNQPSRIWKFFKILRFVVLWGGLALSLFLLYQERVWTNDLEHQANGHMTLISKLVQNASELNANQRRDLLDALRTQQLRRCFLFRPFISIPCAESLSSP